MWFEQVMFFVAGILALGGALGVVMLRNPFYSVLALVTHLLALALLFLLLNAEFIAAALAVELCIAVLGTGLGSIDSRGPDVGAGFGSPAQIGSLLLQKFLVPFEAASYLLLVAAVGAVVLARRRRGLPEDWGLGTGD